MEVEGRLSANDFATKQLRMAAALKEAATTLEAIRRQHSEPVAVVGMACRFPGATTVEQYWDLLYSGRSAIASVPQDRLGNGDFSSQQAGFLKDIDSFDSRFFEITQRESRSLDPQHRLLLEIAWETLENAGVDPSSLKKNRCGVFTGMCSSDYLLRLNEAGLEAIDPYFATGNAHGTASGRVSYFLDWNGPCISIDTACSSSLVAVHLAIQSIHDMECDTALALGVNLILAPNLSVGLTQAGMLSPSGSSCAFSSGADGFVRGEGCGAVLLKRLSDAQRDGDRIFCLLRGSAVNQDGRSNGLTAPNGIAQQEVIRTALKRSGLTPQDIDYIEAHGTSTELGDPIEMGALTSVFATPDQPRQNPLWVGSVKTNIGHLEGAAGIAGLIKTALALHQQKLPPHLHFDKPSQHIDWRPEIKIPTDLIPWSQHPDRVRRAGVSSFGFGGTNAHVILEEAPPLDTNETSSCSQPASDLVFPKTYWLKVSAKSTEALSELASRYAKAFSIEDSSGELVEHELARASLHAISYAGNVGRSDFNFRAAVGFTTREELVARLQELAGKPHSSGLVLTGHNGLPDEPGTTHDKEASKWSRAVEGYVRGEEVDWKSLYSLASLQSSYRRTVSLPTYPFQRQRCWFRTESPRGSVSEVTKPSTFQLRSAESGTKEVAPVSSLLGSRLDVAGGSVIFEVDLTTVASLSEHRLRGESVFPAAGYLELALSAGESTYLGSVTVEQMQLEQALRWSPDTHTRVQVVVEGDTCRILSRQSEGWRDHARCRLRVSDLDIGDASRLTIAPEVPSSSVGVVIGDHYARCSSVGLDYSGEFRSLMKLSTQGSQAFGEVSLPVTRLASTEARYRFHPALLDGCFQSVAALLADEGGLWLPISIGSYRVMPIPASTCDSARGFRFVATMDASVATEQRTVDIAIYDNATNTLFACLSGLVIKMVASNTGVTRPRAPVTSEPVKVIALGQEIPHQVACQPRNRVELTEYLRRRLAAIMECDESEITMDGPLSSMGLDSLMAYELLHDLENNLGINVPVGSFFGGMTLGNLIEYGEDMFHSRTTAAPIVIDWVEGTL